MCFKSSILRKLGNPKMQKREHRQEWTHKGDCIQEVVRVHTEKLERFSKSVTVPKLILPPRKRSQSMSGNDTSSNCSGVSEIHCKDDLFINLKSIIYLFIISCCEALIAFFRWQFSTTLLDRVLFWWDLQVWSQAMTSSYLLPLVPHRTHVQEGKTLTTVPIWSPFLN